MKDLKEKIEDFYWIQATFRNTFFTNTKRKQNSTIWGGISIKENYVKLREVWLKMI